MTRFTVQFELPCEDPVNNVRMKRKRKVLHFFVPINHPDAHNLGLSDLVQAVERREKLDLFTGLNNTAGYSGKETVVSRTYAETTEAAARKVEAQSFRVAPPEEGGAEGNSSSGGGE